MVAPLRWYGATFVGERKWGTLRTDDVFLMPAPQRWRLWAALEVGGEGKLPPVCARPKGNAGEQAGGLGAAPSR